MQASVAKGWGFLDKAVPTPSAFEGVLHVLGASISNERLYAILICVVAVVLLFLLLERTRYGRRLRASAENPESATIHGISVDRSASLAMAIGAGLAGLAGGLAGSIFLVNPYVGAFPLLKGFVALILGGVGSLPGAVLGGFVVGFTESFGSAYLSTTIASSLIFLLLIFALVIRPMGFFGRPLAH